jgi:hypothetical protein
VIQKKDNKSVIFVPHRVTKTGTLKIIPITKEVVVCHTNILYAEGTYG